MSNIINKLLLLNFILLIGLPITAQEKKDINMKTIFEKEINSNITIRQIRSEDSWIKTIISEKKSDKNIELEKLEYLSESRDLAKRLGFILPQDNDRIFDACLISKELFVLQAISGKLILDRIRFYGHDNFDRDRYSLGLVNVIPSSGGEIYYRFKLKINGNYLFFYVEGTHMGTTSFIGCFDVALGRLLEYKFSNDLIRVKDENSIFRNIDFNQNKNWSFINEAIRKLFTDQGRLVENKQFQYLFSFDVSNYELLGQRTQGTTYFFYKDDYPYGKIKVLYYDHYEFEWVLDKCVEKDIEPMR